MSLTSLIVIMLFAGIAGGIINYIFAKQSTTVDNKPNITHSIIIGIGATLLVPLFLELAQSKLLDGIKAGFPYKQTIKTKAVSSDSEIQNIRTDSTSVVVERNSSAEPRKLEDATAPLKNYLLYLAYCFLAAVAGPRFINGVMDGILKEKEIERLSEKNKEINDEKQKAERVINHQNEVNIQMARAEEQEAIQETDNPDVLIDNSRPKIGEITVPDDPQKGRFGGLRERNGRKLCAEVQNAAIPRLYKVKLWVESTDPNNPLDADVVYYLHNTFRPSVFTIKTEDFKAGKATVEPKTAWGSFTVGAVTDNGKTLLEYDLALNTDFPIGFRIH